MEKDNENTLIKLPQSDLTQMANMLAITNKLLPAVTDKTIMLVDDEKNIHRLVIDEIKEVFGNRIKIVSFYDGLPAYEYLRTHHKDLSLIVSNIMMPEMDGLQLLRKCKELNPSLPFIFNTSYDYKEEFSHKFAFDAYIVKSAELTELLNTIARFLFPDDAAVYYNLGIAYYESGMNEEAIEAYKQAIMIKPDDVEAYCSLGNSYRRARMHKEAIETYKQTIRIKPDYTEAYYNLGVIYYSLGMYPEAIETYKQAIRIKPDFTDAHNNLGYIYIKSDMYPEAIEAYKEAIRIYPDDTAAHSNLGIAYINSGDKGAALEQHETLKKLDPELADRLLKLLDA